MKKGYGPEHETWQPERDVQDTVALDDYERLCGIVRLYGIDSAVATPDVIATKIATPPAIKVPTPPAVISTKAQAPRAVQATTTPAPTHAATPRAILPVSAAPLATITPLTPISATPNPLTLRRSQLQKQSQVQFA